MVDAWSNHGNHLVKTLSDHDVIMAESGQNLFRMSNTWSGHVRKMPTARNRAMVEPSAKHDQNNVQAFSEHGQTMVRNSPTAVPHMLGTRSKVTDAGRAWSKQKQPYHEHILTIFRPCLDHVLTMFGALFAQAWTMFGQCFDQAITTVEAWSKHNQRVLRTCSKHGQSTFYTWAKTANHGQHLVETGTKEHASERCQDMIEHGRNWPAHCQHRATTWSKHSAVLSGPCQPMAKHGLTMVQLRLTHGHPIVQL